MFWFIYLFIYLIEIELVGKSLVGKCHCKIIVLGILA